MLDNYISHRIKASFPRIVKLTMIILIVLISPWGRRPWLTKLSLILSFLFYYSLKMRFMMLHYELKPVLIQWILIGNGAIYNECISFTYASFNCSCLIETATCQKNDFSIKDCRVAAQHIVHIGSDSKIYCLGY